MTRRAAALPVAARLRAAPRGRRAPAPSFDARVTRSSAPSTTSSRRARSRRRGHRWKASPFPRGTRTASSASSSTGASTRCPAFGNEWYPRNMYDRTEPEFAHHVATYGPQATFGYKDFIPRFTAEQLRRGAHGPRCSRRPARATSCRSPSTTTASRCTTAASPSGAPRRWARSATSSASSPRRCGPRGWCSACRRTAPSTGGSSTTGRRSTPMSAIRDMPAFYGPAVDRKASEAQTTPPDAAFLDDWLARTAELVDKYQPQLVWFDWWIAQPAFQQPTAAVRRLLLQPRRASGTRASPSTTRSTAASRSPTRPACSTSSAASWRRFARTSGRPTRRSRRTRGATSRTRTTRRWTRSSTTCRHRQQERRLLLNIGPKPDGTIPEPEETDAARDRAMAGGQRRGDLRHAAVDGVRRGADGGGRRARSRDTKRQAFTPRDVRFTTKGKTLYAIVLAWPTEGHATITSLAKGARNAPGEISATCRCWDRRRRSPGHATRLACT